MAHSSKVCILQAFEVEDLKSGIHPVCSNHHHCKLSEALEECREGWQKSYSSYLHPISEWVSVKNRQIRRLQAFSWAIVGQTKIGQKDVDSKMSGPGFPRYGLVQAGA